MMTATMKPGGYYDRTYKQTLRILYTPWQWIALILFMLFLIVFPPFASSHLLTIGIRLGVTIITVVGLNIVVGSTGLLNVGQAAFMAVGAYCSSMLMSRVGINFFPALLAAGIAGTLVGLLFGAPSLRVKGFYVALATLAGYFIIIWALIEWFGGITGHPAPRPEIFGFTFESDISFYYLVGAITLFLSLFAQNLFRSRVGRAFVSLRDHDIAAEILGINIFRYKMLSFGVGCFYAGVAGALQAHFWGYTNIEAFPFSDSIWFLGMVIVGGLGSVLGSVFGAVFFVAVEEVVIVVPSLVLALFPSFADSGQMEAGLKWLIFSMVIILFVVFEPNGMAHRWNLIKSSLRVYPFNY